MRFSSSRWEMALSVQPFCAMHEWYCAFACRAAASPLGAAPALPDSRCGAHTARVCSHGITDAPGIGCHLPAPEAQPTTSAIESAFRERIRPPSRRGEVYRVAPLFRRVFAAGGLDPWRLWSTLGRQLRGSTSTAL